MDTSAIRWLYKPLPWFSLMNCLFSALFALDPTELFNLGMVLKLFYPRCFFLQFYLPRAVGPEDCERGFQKKIMCRHFGHFVGLQLPHLSRLVRINACVRIVVAVVGHHIGPEEVCGDFIGFAS